MEASKHTGVDVDVAIVGAGPSGIGAAQILSETSLKVMLIDENSHVGGQLWRKKLRDNGGFLSSCLNNKAPVDLRESSGFKNGTLRMVTSASVLGVFPEKVLLVSTPEKGLREIRARHIIFATGARERVFPFKGWTLPGVMALGGAQILLKSHGVLPDKEILISGAGPLIYLFGAQVVNARGVVSGILDRSSLTDKIRTMSMMGGNLSKIGQGMSAIFHLLRCRVPVRHRVQVIEARGGDCLEEVVTGKISEDGTVVRGSEKTIQTRMLAVGNGFVPNIELPQLAGCKLDYCRDKGGWVTRVDSSMETSIDGIFAAGEITGIAGGEKAFLEGRLCGFSVIRALGLSGSEKYSIESELLLKKRKQYIKFGNLLNRQWIIHKQEYEALDDDTVICRCEDITMGKIRHRIQQGFRSPADLKKSTRCAMGICQGRTCKPILHDVLAVYRDPLEDPPRALTVRAPVKPVTLGELAGL